MKNLILAGLVSIISLTACNKEKVDSAKSIADQKMEFQIRQVEIERQKLAIEKERFVYEKQKEKDSIAEVAKAKTAAAAAPQAVKTRTVYVNNTPRNNSSGSNSNSNSGSDGGYSTAATPVARKKGMSAAAKGTIIGGVGGAAIGAIVAKKNRGLGAVIGGVAGGATGYTIGRAKDRKTGRVIPRN